MGRKQSHMEKQRHMKEENENETEGALRTSARVKIQHIVINNMNGMTISYLKNGEKIKILNRHGDCIDQY